MVGILIVGKVKIAIASIVKDDREIFWRRGMGVMYMYESVKKC